MKGTITEKETAALMWAAGALESHIINHYGISEATKAQARRSVAVLRRIYRPSLMAMMKEARA